MTDEPFYSPKAKPAPPREPKSGERLFAFSNGADRFACELRDHEEFGLEAQFLLNGELYIARTFREAPAIAPTLAIAWAERQRKAMETGVR